MKTIILTVEYKNDRAILTNKDGHTFSYCPHSTVAEPLEDFIQLSEDCSIEPCQHSKEAIEELVSVLKECRLRIYLGSELQLKIDELIKNHQQ